MLILFALLEVEDNPYGIAVRDAIERSTGRAPSVGAVYTALDRLESRGLVKCSIGEPEARRGGRRKKLFSLEPAGRAALSASFRAIQAMSKGLVDKLEERPG